MRYLLIVSLLLLSQCGATQRGSTRDACTRDEDCVMGAADCCFSYAPGCGVARSRAGQEEFESACARNRCEASGSGSCVTEGADVRAVCVQGFCSEVLEGSENGTTAPQ